MSKNFQRFKKRIGTIVVTTGMLIAMTITVNADTLNITNQTAELRSDASKKCDIIDTLPKGTEVSVLGTEKDWVRVEYNGQTGYISKTSLDTITKKIGTVKAGNSRLNVRNKASMSGKVIGKLYTGNKVEIKGENGDWYKINYKGKTGYISKRYVKVSSKVIAEVEESSNVFKAQIGFYVRTGPETTYTQIGTLTKGQVFQVTGKCSNGWYKIKYGSKIGYISGKYLDKMKDGATDPQVTGTAKVNTKSTRDPYLAIRQGQGTRTKKLDQAKTGTTLEILSDSNPVKGWTKVRYNNLTGYAYTKWLEIGDTPVVKNEAPVITAKDVTIDCGGKLSEDMFNAKAEDKEDGDLTEKITIDTSKVDTSKVGTYDVTLTVKDSKGAEATKTVKVTVKATSPYLEASDVTIEEGDDLKDSAFNIVAKDCEGNKIDVKIDKSKVDTSKAGTYRVTITAEDKWGNGTSIDVKVEVKEKEVKDEAPVITADEITIYIGDNFSIDMLNIKAIDKEDGDLTDKVEVNGSVITNKVGRYVLLLSVTDSYGNETIKDIVVTVKEKSAEVGEYDVNSSQCRAIIQQEMYRLVNEYRTSNGKTEFTVSSKMQNTAWVKSKDMADNNYYSSKLNDKFIWEYKDCEPADKENISLCLYENVKGSKMTNEQCKELASEIFGLWKNAPKYNVNLLDDSLKSIGFDLYMVDVGNDRYNAFATQEFHTTNI